MRQANQFKAGLFILIALGLAIAIFFGVAGSTLILGATRDYTAQFALTDDVSGLANGNDVRIGGVKVGAVKTVEIVDVNAKPVIRVVFRVPAKYELKDGAIVGVQTGLTGLVNLNISSLGSGKPIASNTPIAGIGSPLNQAIASLGTAMPTVAGALEDVRTQTLPKVNTALDTATDAIRTGKQTLETGNAAADQIRVAAADADATILLIKSRIEPILERYNAVADAGKTALGHFGDIFGDSKDDLRTTFANLKDVTQTAKDKLPPLLDKLSGTVDSIKTTVDKTTPLLDDIKDTINNTKGATGNINSILTDNRSRIDEIIKSLNITSTNLGFASSEIRRSPWRLLYKPGEGEVANQNLYDSARQFAEGATKLQDSAAALRDMLKDPKADPDRVKALMGDLDANFAKFDEIEKKLWSEVKK